jgi:general stress protein 26
LARHVLAGLALARHVLAGTLTALTGIALARIALTRIILAGALAGIALAGIALTGVALPRIALADGLTRVLGLPLIFFHCRCSFHSLHGSFNGKASHWFHGKFFTSRPRRRNFSNVSPKHALEMAQRNAAVCVALTSRPTKEQPMPSEAEIEAKFWKALKSDRTMMLGLDGVDHGHARPMTAQFENDRSPIWFFTAKDTAIVQGLETNHRAVATFASKGHDLFATLHGTLSLDRDAATIDRLWNPFVAAWFEGGQQDPKLALLRLDATRAEIWLDDSSFFAGIKMLLGADPKEEYRDKVAEVRLG